MRRLPTVLALSVLLGVVAWAQWRPMREDPAADPKAFDITTRADLEDSIRRVESLRSQLREAKTDREKQVVTESILGLCQDELARQANASGAIVTERSRDPLTPGMATRWKGAFLVLEEMIRSLGPEGLAHYERLYGPRAERLLQEAQQSQDQAAMEGINRRFGLTRAGSRAAVLLATFRWEAGDISGAARALERALNAPELIADGPRASLCAWLGHCYRELGERANLARLAEQAAPLAEQVIDQGGTRVPLAEVLRRNLAEARDTSADTLSASGVDWPGGNHTNTGLHALPTDYAQIAWSRLLPRLAASAQPAFMNYPRPVIGPFLPMCDGNAVYVNTGDRLAAYDLVGGGTGDEPLWACKPFPTFEHNWRTTEPDPAMILPVSGWRGTLFAALENPLTTALHDRNPDPMFGLYSHYPQARRALCAVDSGTGRLLWKLGGLYEGSPDDVTSFLYATVHDGTLYAIGSRLPMFSEVYLYALNPVSGEVKWSLRVCYGQQETTMFGRPSRTPYPSLFAISGGNMYLCTNLGGVVSVDLSRRCLNWISRYDYVPRPITKYTETYYRDVTWANNPTFYAEIAGRGYLVIAPTDSSQMFGLDAASGEIRWRLDREALLGGGRVLVGLRNGVAWVAGDGGFAGDAGSRLRGVDVRLGRVTSTIRVTPVDRAATMALHGRPAMAGNRIFWPGWFGRDCALCEVDLDSGRVSNSAYVPSSYAGWGYSVFCQNGILFTISGTDSTRANNQLAVRFNQSALLDSTRKAAQADPSSAEAALRYGLLALRLADSAEGLKQLRAAFELAGRAPVNTRVRDHASRALVAWHLRQADVSLAARKTQDALGSVAQAREFALQRSQRSECFMRQERALTAMNNPQTLLELFQGLVDTDPDFGVGEDPEIPAATYGRIRLAAIMETRDPAQAAGLYQQIQESPERLAWQGVKLRALGLDRLRELVKAHGRQIYAPQEKAASDLLVVNTPESLARLLRLYPLAHAADEAVLRLASQAMARKDSAEAVALITAALDDNSQRPRRGEINAQLALAHARAGEKLRARLVAARTLREFPDGKLKQGEGEVSFKELLGPIVGAAAEARAATAPVRLPAQPVELWKRDWETGSFTKLPSHPAQQPAPRVYLGERSQRGFELVSLDGPSGELVWSRSIDVSLVAAHDTEHGVLFETAQGLAMFDDAGSERWSLATGGTPNQTCIRGGMLVFGTRFTHNTTRKMMVRVSALDLASGGRMWQAEFEASLLRWVEQCDHGVLLLLSGNDQRLCLLDAESGAVVKDVVLDVTGQVNVAPVLDAGLVWVVDVFGAVRAHAEADLAGKAAFATNQRGASLLRVADGRVLTAGGEGATCIEISTGNTAWTRPLDRGELLRGAQLSGQTLFLCTRDPAGVARVLGVKTTDGTVLFRYTAPRAGDTDRLEVQASAAFDGGLAIAYSVHSMVQGSLQLIEFRLVLLNTDGTERMSWAKGLTAASISVAQLALTDGHLLLACANATFCFGRKP
ncbi:MAG: PQQ-binding-like beta-propeller repeat protein [Planctomycetes bacterium]|nr:PQQ-binding-like beta-propeller repeat protein [Planctomycetota bacterium]